MEDRYTAQRLPPGPPSRGGKGARGLGPSPYHSLSRSSKGPAVRPAPTHAAGALRVTWRLAGGEEREALLRLAEPAATAAAFIEHLRWHAEGLDRFLAASIAVAESATTPDPQPPNNSPSPQNTKVQNKRHAPLGAPPGMKRLDPTRFQVNGANFHS